MTNVTISYEFERVNGEMVPIYSLAPEGTPADQVDKDGFLLQNGQRVQAKDANGNPAYKTKPIYWKSLYPNDVEGTVTEDPNVTWEGDFIEYSPEGEESEAGLDPYFDDNTEDKLSMDSLLLQLSGVETDLNFSSYSTNPVYLIDTDIGVLQIYRYNNSLYFTDPYTGIPCEATCSEASLIRFLQG